MYFLMLLFYGRTGRIILFKVATLNFGVHRWVVLSGPVDFPSSPFSADPIAKWTRSCVRCSQTNALFSLLWYSGKQHQASLERHETSTQTSTESNPNVPWYRK